MRPRLRLGFLPALLIVSILGLSPSSARAESKACQHIRVGAKAPPLALLLPSGMDVLSLRAALAKKLPVVLSFWAWHCHPCLRELPMLQKVAGDLRGHATFLLVHVGPESKMLPKLAALHVTLPSAADRSSTKADAYCAKTLPRTFVVDRTGTIRDIFTSLTEPKLRHALARLGAVVPTDARASASRH